MVSSVASEGDWVHANQLHSTLPQAINERLCEGYEYSSLCTRDKDSHANTGQYCVHRVVTKFDHHAIVFSCQSYAIHANQQHSTPQHAVDKWFCEGYEYSSLCTRDKDSHANTGQYCVHSVVTKFDHHAIVFFLLILCNPSKPTTFHASTRRRTAMLWRIWVFISYHKR